MDQCHFGRLKIVLVGFLFFSLFALSAPTSIIAQTAVDQEKKADSVKPATDESAAATIKRRSTSSLLPGTTRFWVSVEDLHRMEANLSNTQVGKLARQDTLAPFFASFEKQIKDSLNDNGIKFGIDIASIERMETGEVSIAGVLPDFGSGGKPAPRSHGVVVLIDVSPDTDAAKDFLGDAADKMKKRGAKLEAVQMQETEVSKFTVEVKAAKINRTQSSFVAIVDGWLVASDNESIFSDVLRRVKAKSKEPAADSLAVYEPFKTVAEKTRIAEVRPDLRWYVDPLGYARFADALAQENADINQPKDRPLEALAKEGLDALKAAGGFVSFSTGEHDVLHRSLVYANRKKAVAAEHKRLFELLDFAPADSSAATPPSWVPVDAAGYYTMTWDIGKAFNNVGPLVDAVIGKEGNFDAVLDEMKKVPDFKVDIRKMVQSFGTRITIVAKTEEPVNEASEKMVIGIPLKDGVDEKWLIESVGRAVKGKVKKLAGYTCVIDDRTEIKEVDGIGDIPEIDEIEIEEIDDEIDEEEDEEADEKAATPRVTIFNRRIMVIRDGHLLICNDKEYLKKILSLKPTNGFAKAADLSRLTKALGKFTQAERIRFRMFNRLDQMLKTNYEMMRTGKMAESETFVARMLNKVYGKKVAGDEKRAQQIDGSDLPSDYDGEIAPFLGQSGWVMETTDSGWLFTGCVLPKAKAKAQVAEAPDSPDASEESK